MYFQHSSEIWTDFPELVPGALAVNGLSRDVSAVPQIERLNAMAEVRLADASEGQMPEIQAWRHAFSKMNLKPTQYRCASESLLRRFRKEHALPQIHPLIDLCNAVSLAFAIPVAAFDVSRIAGNIEVRYAAGDETYETFSGETESPNVHEVIFVDDDAHVHARRWTNRQSGLSAIRDATTNVLIVAEAMHDSASEDISRLLTTLESELDAIWSASSKTAILDVSSPRFEF